METGNRVIETDIQFRFADVDMLGHVNNVNQQHYFDVGKSDYLKKVFGIDMIWPKQGLITASSYTDYMAQIRPGESVYVETTVEKTGDKSFVFLQRLRSRGDNELKSESRNVMVAFDFELQQSIPVPQHWRDAMVG